jgi:acetyl esterase
MPLDPAAEVLLHAMAQMGGGGLETLEPAEARAQYELLVGSSRPPVSPDATPGVAAVDEREIAGVPCLVVTPEGDGPWPVLVWIHGGGWVIGSAALCLPECAAMAVGVGCVVVSVDYGLAPEVPFPEPLDQCAGVVRWILDHAGELGGDPERVAVGGDSAGGNLAAAVALEAPGLRLQVLVYPAVDCTLSHASIDENGEGYLLTRAAIEWFTGHYVGDADRTDPRASPLHAPEERLAAAPPAFVITAEFDPLRDEGEAYAARLRDAGVAVRAERWDGQIHGFFTMAELMPAGKDAQQAAIEELRAALSPRG